MKMNLHIPYDRVNSRGQYMSKETILDALHRRGFLDNSIQIDEGNKIIYVFIDVVDIKDDGVVVFEADLDENYELFPIAPLEKP